MVSVARYVINVCMITKDELEKLDKIVKSIQRNEGFHGKHTNDERLYAKRKDSGRELRSSIDIYKKNKVRAACCITTSTNGRTTNGRS